MFGLGLLGGHLDNSRKTGGIGNCQIRKHLAVDFDPGLFQTMYELAVAHIIQTRTGVDSGYPQAPKITFPFLPIPVGIHECLVYGIGSRAEEFAATTAKSLGQFQDLFPPSSCFKSTFDSHYSTP